MDSYNKENLYLIPANAKRGNLIFNIFRSFDLILFGSGIMLSLVLLAMLDSSNTLLVILACIPGCICSLLVVPIPNYHNVLCAIQSMIEFILSQKKYKWRGWCIYEQFRDEKKK